MSTSRNSVGKLAAQRFELPACGWVLRQAQHRLDNAWEQKKLEARKMLDAKRAAREASHTSGARFVGPLLWNGVTLVFFFGHAFYTQGVMNFSAGISNVLLVSFNTNLLTSTNES